MSLRTPEKVRKLQEALHAKAKESPDFRFFWSGGSENGRNHRGVDAHAQHRLRQWLRAKHKVRGQGFARFPDKILYQDLGLIRVQGRPRIYPWANA